MSNPIADHFKQPAGVPAVTLCSGVLTVWLVVLFGIEKPDDRQIFFCLGVFTALPSLLYLLWRVVRPFSKTEAKPAASCPICGKAGPTVPVRYLQLTGVVVVMFMRELPAYVCRSCSRSAFLKMTLHTLVLGWWSLFSLFVTPGYLVSNVLFLVRGELFGSGAARSHARQLLDDRRDYAKNLKATKDEATVLDVLARDTGLDRETIRAWLITL